MERRFKGLIIILIYFCYFNYVFFLYIRKFSQLEGRVSRNNNVIEVTRMTSVYNYNNNNNNNDNNNNNIIYYLG